MSQNPIVVIINSFDLMEYIFFYNSKPFDFYGSHSKCWDICPDVLIISVNQLHCIFYPSCYGGFGNIILFESCR